MGDRKTKEGRRAKFMRVMIHSILMRVLLNKRNRITELRLILYPLWCLMIHAFIKGDIYWVRAKEIHGWVLDFMEGENEEDDSDEDIATVDSDKENEDMNDIHNKEGYSECEEVPETVFEQQYDTSKQGDFMKLRR
ncbi:hypothetical protein Tco_1111393 [Tanacetum coccineum]|uniref:Uncharacterized protein n=1 Tax=Tanacetum coccineum TaxID=301880 RepID=A0ABQ5IMZ5_9ASTR